MRHETYGLVDTTRKRVKFNNEPMDPFRAATQRLIAAGYTGRGIRPKVRAKGKRGPRREKALNGPLPVIRFRAGVTAMGGMVNVQVRH